MGPQDPVCSRAPPVSACSGGADRPVAEARAGSASMPKWNHCPGPVAAGGSPMGSCLQQELLCQRMLRGRTSTA